MKEQPEPNQGEGLNLDHQKRWPIDPHLRRAAIELELKRIRNAASVARLEARAAELELMLRQIDHGECSNSPGEASVRQSNQEIESQNHPTVSPRFESWDQVREAQKKQIDKSSTKSAAQSSTLNFTSGLAENSKPKQLRFDAPDVSPKRPRFLDSTIEINTKQSSSQDPASQPQRSKKTNKIKIPKPSKEPNQRRRRPTAFIISGLVHVGLIILLGLWQFTRQQTKDQLSLTSSTVSNPQEEIETLTLETSELNLDQAEEISNQPAPEFNPVGQIVSANFSIQEDKGFDQPTSWAAPSKTTATENLKLLTATDSSTVTEFCGVKGGGNHFVYLVDSSGSMGDAFASARLELLSSIASLKPDQRFYVIFFDEKTDYMRLNDPNVDEPHSVMATTENKERLRRWAMRVSMDRGRAPYDGLRFALQLKPDVIFLLSDGEFPKRIETLLDSENRIGNLFGDNQPISIVHTIGYHSEEGEQRMRRIAQQNQGQYRYVPKPR